MQQGLVQEVAGAIHGFALVLKAVNYRQEEMWPEQPEALLEVVQKATRGYKVGT